MPAAAQRVRTRVVLPRHDYADKHKLLLASREVRRRHLRDAADLVGLEEVACERIREFAYDLGIEDKKGVKWKKHVSKKLGMNYDVLLRVVNEKQFRVGIKTINAVARATGIPVRVICDPTQ